MIRPTRRLSKLMVVLALVLGVGSVVAMAAAPLGALRLLRPAWSEPSVLLWDTALSLLFFAQHSGMVRPGVRARMARAIAPVYIPAIYASASGVALGLVVLLWQPSELRIVALAGPLRVASQALALAAVGLFVWGARSLRTFDPLGLSPVVGQLRAQPPQPSTFVVRGAYRLVRHPLYLAVLVLFWSCPDVTLDRLLFNLLWTAWIVVGTLLEEADLVAEFGEAYRAYRRTVPMLVPWPTSVGRLPVEEQSP